jgi:two-component system sensor histidine kinase DesK
LADSPRGSDLTDSRRGGFGLAGPRRGGSGLAGLAEWVSALDGTLTAGPAEPSGWRVRVVVPA